MLKIKGLKYSNSGKKITYNYNYSKAISKYFNSKEPFFVSYDVDVREVPESIAIIPFLANLAPISWFAGFNIHIEKLDKVFYESICDIKREYEKYYPEIKKIDSEIVVGKIEHNKMLGNRSAMLFSGGVDAYSSLFRHYDSYPDLITVHGPDIDLADSTQWNRVVESNKKQQFLKNYDNLYIKSNLRLFYTYKVNYLLKNAEWWSKIQYGLGLTSLLAPLSFLKNYNKIYIASTRSKFMKFLPWGSMPETDNKIAWSGLSVIHDGFDLSRQDKLEIIIKMYNKFNLYGDAIRVCYSELNKSINCSKCEKCVRTSFGIMLLGGNPCDFGFDVDESIYNEIKKITSKEFGTSGVLNYWTELLNLSKQKEDIFIFKNKNLEKNQLADILKSFELNSIKGVRKQNIYHKLKFKIQNEFPKLFKLYLKIRQRNL